MAKIPVILEPGRADGKLAESQVIYDSILKQFQSDINEEYKLTKEQVEFLTPIIERLNDVKDTLTSIDADKPLSAQQGKILKELLDSKVIEIGAIPLDSEPTEGNIGHVVTSDGINKALNKKVDINTFVEKSKNQDAKLSKLEIEKGRIKIDTTEENKYIDLWKTVGTWVDIKHPVTSTSGYCYKLYPCEEGDMFNISGVGGEHERLWGFVDANQGLLSVADANAIENNLILIAPENAKNIIIHDKSNSSSYYSSKYSLDAIKANAKDLEKLSNSTNNWTIGSYSKRISSEDYNDWTYIPLMQFKQDIEYTFLISCETSLTHEAPIYLTTEEDIYGGIKIGTMPIGVKELKISLKMPNSYKGITVRNNVADNTGTLWNVQISSELFYKLDSIIKQIKDTRFIIPEDFGAVGDGKADDTEAMKLWAASAMYHNIATKEGSTYLIKKGLVVPLNETSMCITANSYIKAGSYIWEMIRVYNESNKWANNCHVYGGGIIDCNKNADRGIRVIGFLNIMIEDLLIRNAKMYGIYLEKLNDMGYSGSAFVRNLKIYNDDNYCPENSVGLLNTLSDSYFDTIEIKNFRSILAGHALVFRNIHGWCRTYTEGGVSEYRPVFFTAYGNAILDTCYADGTKDLILCYSKGSTIRINNLLWSNYSAKVAKGDDSPTIVNGVNGNIFFTTPFIAKHTVKDTGEDIQIRTSNIKTGQTNITIISGMVNTELFTTEDVDVNLKIIE